MYVIYYFTKKEDSLRIMINTLFFTKYISKYIFC